MDIQLPPSHPQLRRELGEYKTHCMSCHSTLYLIIPNTSITLTNRFICDQCVREKVPVVQSLIRGYIVRRKLHILRWFESGGIHGHYLASIVASYL